MKRALLAGGLVVAVLVGTVWAAYTADVSGDGQKALLVAIEYLISDGVTANAGTDLDTSALALDASVDGLETSAAAIAADANELTAAPVAKTITPLVKEVAASGTGVALVASETFARKVYLMAKKTAGANTGLVYIGTSTVDVAGPQQMTLAPGDSIVIDPGLGCKVDLATIYIDCAAGNTDGVTGWYIPL